MCSNGLILKVYLISLILFSINVQAEDVGWIAMPGQIDENLVDGLDASDEESSSIFNTSDEYLGNGKSGNTNFIPGKTMNSGTEQFPTVYNGSSITVPGSGVASSYAEFSNDQILDRVFGKWESSFGVAYILDNYTYADRNGIFESVYRSNSDSAKNYGTFFLKFREKLGSIFFLGGNLGLGFNSGNGYFIPDGVSLTNAEESSTEFKLYTVPLELVFGVKANFTRYMNLSLSGGPGVMGLWQHRDDRSYDEDSKNLRQVGYGYHGEVSLGFVLSRIFSQFGIDLLSNYGIASCSLNLYSRVQNYANFKSTDIEISGSTIGAGFTFEYL